MLTHSAVRESSSDIQHNSVCLSVCLHASLSVSPSARQLVSVILNRSSVCDHSDEDGWRDTDDGGKDTIRLDSAIPGMS